MGMYTGLRFQGIVKEKFRKDFDKVTVMGRWDMLEDNLLAEFGSFDRSHFIPHGSLNYMPDSWDNEDKIEHIWDEKTGHWEFQCSLKNYSQVIEEFITLLPYLCEYVNLCEVMYEEDEYSTQWKIRNNYPYIATNKFRKYSK